MAKGSAGLATRHVSSRNSRPSGKGMAYRNEGTSRLVPHSPLPPAGCSSCASLLAKSDQGSACLGDLVGADAGWLQMLSMARVLHRGGFVTACSWQAHFTKSAQSLHLRHRLFKRWGANEGALVSSRRPDACVVPPEVHEEHAVRVEGLAIARHLCLDAIGRLHPHGWSAVLVAQKLASCCSSSQGHQPV